jgi:hypothetical protein
MLGASTGRREPSSNLRRTISSAEEKVVSLAISALHVVSTSMFLRDLK